MKKWNLKKIKKINQVIQYLAKSKEIELLDFEEIIAENFNRMNDTGYLIENGIKLTIPKSQR